MFANFKLVEVTIERNYKKESTGRFKSQKWHFQVIFGPKNLVFIFLGPLSMGQLTAEWDSTFFVLQTSKVKYHYVAGHYST